MSCIDIDLVKERLRGSDDPVAVAARMSSEAGDEFARELATWPTAAMMARSRGVTRQRIDFLRKRGDLDAILLHGVWRFRPT